MRLEIDKKGMVMCPMEGRLVKARTCEKRIRGKNREPCRHFGFFPAGGEKMVCRYTEEREIRLTNKQEAI